jgi:uncharacterized protein
MGALRFSSIDQTTGNDIRLYGYLTLPQSGAHHSHAVLLCNPFGQEAVRAHRLYRVLADRLSKLGIPSLRFDYFGTGDSDGDDEYAPMSIPTCLKNLTDADLFLREQAKTDNVSWFGLRFGAMVAVLASSQTPLTPDRLFLWDPIENGTDWMQSLREDHVKALQLMMLSTTTGSQPTTGQTEFESQGYRITPEMVQFLSRFTFPDYKRIKCSRLFAMGAGAAQAKRLEQLDHCPNINSFALVQVGEAHWNSDEAMNTAIVPQDIINAVVGEMSASGL